jgi:hypothetical protein
MAGLGDLFAGGSAEYEGPYRRIREGERTDSAMITWSHSGKHTAPTTKADFMRRIGERLEDVQAKHLAGLGAKMDMAACRIAIFEELHADLSKHFHAIVAFPGKSRAGSYLEKSFFSTGVAVHVRTHSSKGGSSSSADRFLAYCMSITEEKWLVDANPLLYRMEVPEKIASNLDRSYSKMAKRPATLDNLYAFLKAHPGYQIRARPRTSHPSQAK